MTLSEIEVSIHESIDSGDSETLEMYAAHCAESLNELGELLCSAIIGTDFRAWHAVIGIASLRAPGLAGALLNIEQHCDRQRASFIEARARNIADAAEHDAQMLAELNAELNRGCM